MTLLGTAQQPNTIPTADERLVKPRLQELYDAVISSVPSSLLMIDQSLRIVAANRNFLEKARRTEASTLGQRIDQVFTPVLMEQSHLNQRIRQVFTTRQPVEGDKITYRAPGVPTRTYYYRLAPVLEDQEVAHVILLMDDVTEQERLTNEVRRVERHLASVVECANDLVVSTDAAGRILTWNRAAEAISGWPTNEIIGRELVTLCPEAQQPSMADMLDRLVRGHSTPNLELNLITRDGRVVAIAWACSLMRDNQEQIIGCVAVGRDLTEQRRLEGQVLQASKMAALGIMAGGIAHEVRNPLAIIAATSQLAAEADDDAELRHACLERIQAGTQRASQIIENLLKFAQPARGRLERLDVAAALAETLDLLANQLTMQRVKIEVALAPELPKVNGNRGLLQQVFTNLILNACQAMPQGGRLSIAGRVEPGGKLALSFNDTGQGIPPDHLDKLFDPFFTTLPVGQGVGLGLAISYSIIQQHQGTIEVESRPGGGSTFTTVLPPATEDEQVG